MPDYRSYDITRGAPALPDPAAVPGKVTSPGVAHDCQRGLDTVLGSGNRVLIELGLRGAERFLVADGTNTFTAPSRAYPDESTPRVVARANRVPITPGHWVGIEVLALPSGPTQYFFVGDVTGFFPSGAGGSVSIEVTYRNGDAQTTTVTTSVEIAGSVEVYNAEPPNAWAAIVEAEAIAVPISFPPSAAELQKWTRGIDVTADVVVRYIGSPRVVDLAVIEVPFASVVETADPRWPAPYYTEAGDGYGQLPSDYPIEQLSSTDPGGGTVAIQRALAEHGRSLGPMVFYWSCASENQNDLAAWISYDSGTGDDEAPAYSSSNAADRHVPTGAATYSEDLPGWPLGCYARPVDAGDDFFDGRTGVIPVIVDAYVRVTAGTGTWTIKTDAVGWGDISWSTDSTTWRWVRTAAWLEVGTGPESGKIARLWDRCTGGGSTQIRYIHCYYRQR